MILIKIYLIYKFTFTVTLNEHLLLYRFIVVLKFVFLFYSGRRVTFYTHSFSVLRIILFYTDCVYGFLM